MGYYSMVKILVDLPKRNVLEVAEELKNFKVFDRIRVNEESNLLLAECNYIKWYGRFDEIMAVENWLTKMEEAFNAEEPEPGGIHYVRAGEETDDIEQRYYGDVNNYLSVIVAIEDGDFY